MVTGHRPFNGRSMTELTDNITSGKLQPPSFYNPELSPQLEQIILTALGRDRNERYNEACLMSQDLRKLNLEPLVPPILPTSSAQGPHLSRGYSQTPREQATFYPPERLIQHPTSLTTEIQPPAIPFFRFPEPKDNNPFLLLTTTQLAQKREIPSEGQNPLPHQSDRLSEEGKKIVGDRANSPPTSEPQALDQHGIWHQLQRLFRPPQR
jgi:hypothetical protein